MREFNVVPNLDAAEYGHRGGGQVGIVTPSGTNAFHGSLYEFLRNSALDARDFFDRKLSSSDPRIPPFRRNQFGGSAGGPIQRDKTFIFGNYEGFRQAWNLTKVSVVPDDQARPGRLPNSSGVYQPVQGFNPAVVPYFALWPSPQQEIFQNGLPTGTAYSYSTTPNPVREDFGIVRVDRTFSDKDTFNAAYTIDDGNNVGTGQNPFSLVTNIERSQVLSLGEVHVFSPNIVNNFTAGFSRVWFRYAYSVSISPPGAEPFVAGKPLGQINIGGTQGNTSVTPAGSGPNTGHDQLNIDNMFTYQDQVRITKGIHSIAFGAWLERLQSNDLSGSYGQVNFPTLLSFLQGKPSLFQVTQPAAHDSFSGLDGSLVCVRFHEAQAQPHPDYLPTGQTDTIPSDPACADDSFSGLDGSLVCAGCDEAHAQSDFKSGVASRILQRLPCQQQQGRQFHPGTRRGPA